MSRVMRGERWEKLRRLDGVETSVAAIASAMKDALIEQMRLKAKLEKLQRAAGYSPDLAAALAELEDVGDVLQQHFAVAMARLPSKQRTEHLDAVLADKVTA